MSWLLLLLASVFEVGWAVGLKLSGGFTRIGVSVATGIALVLSVSLLGLAVRTLPLGSAYAVWTGLGTVGTVLAGMVWFGEAASPLRLACVALILAGVIGLKLAP